MKRGRFDSLVRVCALAAGAWALAACAPKQVKVSAKAPAAPAPAKASAARAAAAPAPKAPELTFAQARRGAKVLRLHAVVKSVDSAHDELVVKTDGGVRIFKIASDTKINEGGGNKTISLSAVRAGDHVRIIHAGDYAGIVHVMVL